MKKLVLFAMPLMAVLFAVSCKKQEPPVPAEPAVTEAPATTENATEGVASDTNTVTEDSAATTDSETKSYLIYYGSVCF